jgi:periplasmic protein TonB
MEPKGLVYRTWDELVFEHRNKAYGAYVIRKSYNDKVLLGLGVSVVFLAILLTLPKLFPESNIVPKLPVLPKPYIFSEDPYIIPNKKVEPVLTRPQQETRRTDTTPLVVTEEVETPKADIASPPADDRPVGDGEGGPSTGTVAGFVDAPEVVELPKEFVIVEIMPAYEGGHKEMLEFLKRKFRYPPSAKRLGIEGTVFVSFLVKGDGSVADVKVLRGIHPDCDKEAVRVISLMNKWKGGKQGGSPVSVRMALPITFKLN